ncbi:MAG: undecaprenyldiphospho-muramoylpentapeptide beta-N-acetylglucosaminyltransferase [Burkholderiales bacterium]|jgi:UDP-N-acetylglucosamine--N-acetylmuramyl-(pentapeptide) pyrophosphoryl-undecaprenol N-acetylglucosamine transferase
MSKTILIMAGGTGGHIFPALAVADDLKSRGWRVVWLGSHAGMEAKIVPEQGYQTEWIRFGGLRGKGLVRAALLPLNLLIAFWQSARVIFRVRPDVVLGMGGYISFPGGMMAALFFRPLVVHEQNAVAGMANKVLATVADCLLTGFPGVFKRAICTGNPVRKAIYELPEPETRFADRAGALRLLVVGGSLGAKPLNETLPAALAILPESSRPQVTHQSGRQHLDSLRSAYREQGVEAEVVAFIDDMADAYACADLVVCRAGAITVAELAAAGVASILVPLPHAVDDHQAANARFLAERDAAVLIPQRELTPRRMADAIAGFTRRGLCQMATRARELGRPDAASEVANQCVVMAG